MKNQIRVYVGHSIRGKKGKDATEQDMKNNNDKAIVFGKRLRKKFPSINFYVPGGHDEFVLLACLKKYLTEKQIVDTDCAIIRRCNFIVAYSPDGYLSRGMVTEIEFAGNNCIPVIQIPGLGIKSTDAIRRQLLEIME